MKMHVSEANIHRMGEKKQIKKLFIYIFRSLTKVDDHDNDDDGQMQKKI